MQVLVTGGAGFIGSHVTEQLLALGADVIVVDDLSTGASQNVANGATLVVGDVRAPWEWRKHLRRLDVVIHLAGQISVALSERHPVVDADINLLGTLNMLLLAQELGAREFRFASSAAVYGDGTLPLSESLVPDPISFYGISKLAAEWSIHHFCQRRQMAAVVFRLANVYGPRQRTEGEGGVVALFAEAVAEGRTPVIFGDGQQTRDFIAVEDVARALTWQLGRAGGQRTFNVSTTIPTSVLKLWSALAHMAGVPANRVTFGPPRPGDIRHSLLDSQQIRQWGWAPTVALTEGLENTFQYFATTRRKDWNS